MPARKRKRRAAVNGEMRIVAAASDRAYYDALHQHFLKLAYERLKDPEFRVILEEFLEKTHRLLARRKKS